VPLGRQVSVPAMQAELLRLASGAVGVSLLWADVPADGCATLVRDLAALLLRPGWDGWGRARSEDDAAQIRRRGLADLQPAAARDALAGITSILADMTSSKEHGDRQMGQGDQPGGRGLLSLVQRLSAEEQDGLRASAAGWGPELARAVEVAVLHDRAERRRVAVAAEHARHEAAWVRQAAKRHVLEARQRIAARAARRAVARQRKAASRGPAGVSGPV